uniref:RagB/SusD family nutrient uptake outer membrane protein n=1 Tax=uncultured Draconibacterium sp. TaxID=1573823 RepID=UPI003216974A
MRKNIFIIVLFLTAFLFNGCNEDLNLAPLDTVSDPSFWKSKEDFEKATTEFYHSLGSASNGGKDQNSDITVGNVSNNVSAGTYIAPSESGTWNNSYAMIRATTRVTKNYEEAADIQEQTARYAAEARFFRARAYFDLLSSFGDVPLIKTVLDIDSEELFAPRIPRAEVVAYIFEDLDWAVSRLPKESELTDKEKGRITKGAALALLSRVALFEGTWSKFHGTGSADSYLAKCIEASRQLISLGEYELYKHPDGPAASYYNLFIEGGQGSKESILARKYSEVLNIHHNAARWVETHFNSPTKKLADMYLCTNGLPIDNGNNNLFKGYDTRASEFEDRDPRMSQTFKVPGIPVIWNEAPRIYEVHIGGGTNGPTKSGYQAFKFQSGTKSAAQGNSYYDYMEYRFGEVLLNLAEALYEKDDAISDADLDATINKLRDRAGMPDLTNAFVAANGLNMQAEIRRERTIELAYEGFRHSDLRRWKSAETELPVALLGVKFVGTEWPTIPPNDGIVVGVDIQVDSDGFVIADDKANRKFEQKHYLFPIPLNQIQLNPNLEQNSGW